MPIDAVVFDIGNVLIEWNPERFYDRTIGEARRRAMFAELDLHAMNDRVDQGEVFRDVVYAFAEAHPEWRAEIRMWHDHWLEMASPDIPMSARLLMALKARGIPVFALSNFGRETFAIAEPVYPILGAFDRRYISGHMGAIKPAPRIYEMLEADCGVAPDRLLFTDDRADNIATAAARGWQTHLFDGPEGFQTRLLAEGLIEAPV